MVGGTTDTVSLAQVDLFSALTPSELESLNARVRRRRYAKGTVIFVEGDPGNSLYVIESGHVKITLTSPDGRELVITTYGPGDFFGEMALLDEAPRSADAVAVDDCHLALLQRTDFVHFVESHPQAAARLLAELTRRLRRITRQHQEATLLDVSARVASALLQLAADQGQPAPGEAAGGAITIERPMTQAELAAQIGVTRESVNKWLRHYQRRGWLRWEKGQLTILQPDELRKRLA